MPSTPWQLLLPVNAIAVVDATNIMRLRVILVDFTWREKRKETRKKGTSERKRKKEKGIEVKCVK